MILEKKKEILQFLEKNPGVDIASAGFPEHTLRVLLKELEQDFMVVKDKKGWRLTTGKDILKQQTADQCMRDMVRIGLSK